MLSLISLYLCISSLLVLCEADVLSQQSAQASVAAAANEYQQPAFNFNNDADNNNSKQKPSHRRATDYTVCKQSQYEHPDINTEADCDGSQCNCTAAPGFHNTCFTVWRNDTSIVTIRSQGCWEAQKSINHKCSKGRCIARKPTNDNDPNLFFCCCFGNKCNEDISYEPEPNTDVGVDGKASHLDGSGDDGVSSFEAVLYAFIPIVLLALIILIIFWVYRRHQMHKFLEKAQLAADRAARDGGSSTNPSGRLASPQSVTTAHTYLRPIQLIQVTARGRFGQVWKAKCADQPVAVKVFPPQDADSWVQEQDIYAVSGMRENDNILTFIGAEVRYSGMQAEYWLITVFCDNGSLADYLKTNTVSLRQAYYMIVTMLKGLSFLHEEQLLGNNEIRKPCIVHRDLKSRNILVKNDLSVCIADFGLALKCEHGRTPEDTHAQVGTRRYMSPEILEGAAEFSAFAFRQVDVYAAALIMWEVLQRTEFNRGESVPNEYKLPFEEEIGLHPTLEDMKDLVVIQKRRPVLNEQLWHEPHGGLLLNTIEEMWDSEPEARITSGCAWERLSSALAPSTRTANQHSHYQSEGYPYPHHYPYPQGYEESEGTALIRPETVNNSNDQHATDTTRDSVVDDGKEQLPLLVYRSGNYLPPSSCNEMAPSPDCRSTDDTPPKSPLITDLMPDHRIV